MNVGWDDPQVKDGPSAAFITADHHSLRKPVASGGGTSEAVNHPSHYGGADNVYEAIKVIEAHSLGFHLGNAVKYILRAGKKGKLVEDLKKARWYIDREIANQESDNGPAART